MRRCLLTKAPNGGVITALILALLLVVLVTGCAGSQAQSKNITNKSTLRAPRLIGLDLERARGIAQKAGLKVEIDSWEHDKAQPCHCIVKQIPEPGAKVNSGDTVNVVVNEITN